MNDSQVLNFARLPSIDRILSSAGVRQLIEEYGRGPVKRWTREALQSLREEIKRGSVVDTNEAAICAQMKQAIVRECKGRIRRVINLSGTILHTNLGRASLPQTSIDAVVEVMRGASNLEYDLDTGKRGHRDAYLEQQICRLTGAEAATVVNNNAAAVMLVLNALALAKEVPVSRGELVEIGGSFRIPDIMRQSGCQLIEVGTTNRTHPQDFTSAINARTALIMKVHQSNYHIQGFTAAVDDKALAKICSDASIPFVVDLGSGTLVNLGDYDLPHEPTPMESLNAGADLVTFSGDKLLGGPQAGIIVGRRDLIGQLNANPMKRALRCDKMTIAALSSLLQLYNHTDRLPRQLPVLRAMTRSTDEIRTKVTPLVGVIEKWLDKIATVSLVDCESEIGSGALPDQTISSIAIAMSPLPSHVDLDEVLNKLAKAFRRLPIPVIGRVHKGDFLLDCRCLEDVEEFSAQLCELKFNE